MFICLSQETREDNGSGTFQQTETLFTECRGMLPVSFINCVVQAGLELVILLPLHHSANPTYICHHSLWVFNFFARSLSIVQFELNQNCHLGPRKRVCHFGVLGCVLFELKTLYHGTCTTYSLGTQLLLFLLFYCIFCCYFFPWFCFEYSDSVPLLVST